MKDDVRIESERAREEEEPEVCMGRWVGQLEVEEEGLVFLRGLRCPPLQSTNQEARRPKGEAKCARGSPLWASD